MMMVGNPLPGPLPEGRGERLGGVNRHVAAFVRGNAKRLRGNMTEAEKTLWYHLRAERFAGYKFRRQHPLGNYIVDFVCLKEKLIIEVDGGQHTIEKDAKRAEDLQALGFNIMRFWNNEVTENLEGVLTNIMLRLNSLSLQGEG